MYDDSLPFEDDRSLLAAACTADPYLQLLAQLN
jgi:hypothetical protein